MNPSFPRTTLPLALAALVLASALPARADEKTPAADGGAAPAVAEVGVAFEKGLSFDQGVARAKADGKTLFIDFWRDH